MLKATAALLTATTAGSVLLALPASALAGAPPRTAAATMNSAPRFSFAASAFGTTATVDAVVRSGRSASVTLGCQSSPGIMHTNTAASVTTAPLLTSGTIDTTAASQTTSTGVAARASATTQQVHLLNGLITATTVTAVSTTADNTVTGLLSSSGAGTRLAGLHVAGHAVSATAAPNTRITLPGVGFVVLNQQSSTRGPTGASLTVSAIHVVVTAAHAIAPSGTQITVASSTSGLTAVAGMLSGGAYGTYAALHSVVTSGKSFPVALSCAGTNGQTRSNTGAAVTAPELLSTGAIANTAEGTVTWTHVSGRTTATVHDLNLLGGIVTAQTVVADTSAAGHPATLTDGSHVIGLHIAGFPAIGDDVAPNTTLNLLPGVTLRLHSRTTTGGHLSVVMIQLTVTGTNRFALPTGTVINVASSNVGVG